jgi:hypothetical protein
VGAVINLSPIPSFELVSIYDPDPAQSCSQATTDDAIKFLYAKLMTDAVNEMKKIIKTKLLTSLLVGKCTKCTLNKRPLRYWSRHFRHK